MGTSPCLIIWSHYRITEFYVFAIGCEQLSFECLFIYLYLEKCFSGLYVCRSGAAKTMKPIGSLQGGGWRRDNKPPSE